MKKNFMSWATFAFLGLAGVSIAVSSCTQKENVDAQGNPIPTTRDSLEIALANQDSLLILMNDISEGMMQIKSLENILSSPSNLNGESASRRDQIRNDMQSIEIALAERRQRLEELEKKLKASNSSNTTLQKSIATLKQQIEAQETTISGLRDELSKANIKIEALNQSVDSLSNTVTAVTVAKEQVENKNQELTNEMNVVYYSIGTSKELKEAGLLVSGGFLRSAKINPADFKASLFTKADKRNLSTINLHSNKAKVMTPQPADSYRIDDNGGQKVLVITDPARFWNQSPYLVVKID